MTRRIKSISPRHHYCLPCECMENGACMIHIFEGNIEMIMHSENGNDCIDFAADYVCEHCGRTHRYVQRFYADKENRWIKIKEVKKE